MLLFRRRELTRRRVGPAAGRTNSSASLSSGQLVIIERLRHRPPGYHDRGHIRIEKPPTYEETLEQVRLQNNSAISITKLNINQISMLALKGSISILRNHLYGQQQLCQSTFSPLCMIFHTACMLFCGHVATALKAVEFQSNKSSQNSKNVVHCTSSKCQS